MSNAPHSVGHDSTKALYAHDFQALGVKDLLDARDQFHVHFAHKPNVFSTAVGRYLIREIDPDSKHDINLTSESRKLRAKPRTLFNSAVRRWSWPCILVFVNEWQTLEDLRSKPEEVVPPFIYLADGRIVPVCVVLVESGTLPPRAVSPFRLAASTLGIGSPIYVDAQGMRRMGTIACMVSDGSDFYLLTNTHLAGESGRPAHALLRGIPQLVGTTQGTRNLTEKTFPNLSGTAGQRFGRQYRRGHRPHGKCHRVELSGSRKTAWPGR